MDTATPTSSSPQAPNTVDRMVKARLLHELIWGEGGREGGGESKRVSDRKEGGCFQNWRLESEKAAAEGGREGRRSSG